MKPVTETVEIETFELSRGEMELIYTIVGNCHMDKTTLAALKQQKKLSQSDIMQTYNSLGDVLY